MKVDKISHYARGNIQLILMQLLFSLTGHETVEKTLMQTVTSQISFSFDHDFIRLIFCILCKRKTLFFDFRKIMSGFSFLKGFSRLSRLFYHGL
jgi:hypothetical protein